MWEPVDLPFQNSQPLPALPTADEICACTNVLWETRTSKIVAVNDDIVIKYGTRVQVWEGQALIYLERHAPEVPVPRLFAMYYVDFPTVSGNESSGESGRGQAHKQLFLIMQRIPGVQLNLIWPSLKPSEKDDIVAKLKLIFDAMRKIECPWPDFFGSLDGSGLHHYLFYSQQGDMKFLGPFFGESAFIAGLIGNYRALVDRNNHPDYKCHFFEKHFPCLFQGHRPTLTHGDVQQKNIMVMEYKSPK